MDIFNNKKNLIIAGVALVSTIILMTVLLLYFGFGTTSPKSITLQFWGVYDESKFFGEAIRAYETKNRNVHVIYRQIDFANYEKQLIDSFAAATGPDIWLMHNTWLPKHLDKIKPLPQEPQQGAKQPIFTFKDFQDQFVDATISDLTSNGQIYAMPTYTDTLALYWNKDIFNSQGITLPPSTWDEFNDDILRITTFDQKGNIVQSGAAIGTAKNINRSTDILSLLFLQSGTQMTDDDNRTSTLSRQINRQNVAESALQYYTDFANPSKQLYTWNDNLHYSIDAFQEGGTAMMFNYSHILDLLRAKSSRLNFGIAPMPQFANSNTRVNYANYWAPTVSKASPQYVEAWKFLAYLTSQEGNKHYIKASHRVSARRDIIDSQKSDPDLGVFATQALSARSWYEADTATIETIFADMIEDVNFRRVQIRDALRAAESKISVLMRKTRNK